MIWLLLACQQKLQSPTLTVEGSDPNLVCNSQLVTELDISGTNFSPLPVGVLTEEASLTPPDIWISRVQGAYLVDEQTEMLPENLMFSLAATRTWTSDTLLELSISPEDAIPAGSYNLHVQNPDGQEAMAEEAITIVDAPVFALVDPMKVCVDGRDQTVQITGSDFLVGETAPLLRIGQDEAGQILESDSEEECVELNGVTTYQTCSLLTYTFPDGSLEIGLNDLYLTNPDPAACSTVVPFVVEAVRRPHLDEVVSNFECVQQGDQEIILNGSDFVVLADGTTPMVSFGTYEALADSAQGCTHLLGADQGQVCTQLTLRLPEDVQEPGVFSVKVTNPAPVDCESSEEVLLELLPRPELSGIDIALECTDQEDQTIILSGTGFLVLEDGSTPIVQVGDVMLPSVASDCIALEGAYAGQSCTTLEIVLPQDSAVGVHDITVHNPQTGECVSEELVQIEVVAQPHIISFSNVLECVEQASQSMHITGTGFLQLSDGTLPVVTVGAFTATDVVLSNCTALLGPAGGESCTDIDFSLAEDGVEVGLHDIVVQNPETAYCITEENPQLETIGRPHADALSVEMSCIDQQSQQITITGSNFLRTQDQVLPHIDVGSYGTSADEVFGCVELEGSAGGLLCSGLRFTLPLDVEVPGVHDVVVTNPETALCASEELRQMEILDTPVVGSIVQDVECIAQDDKTFTLSGSGFVVLADGTTPWVQLGTDMISADSASGCVALNGPAGGEVCTQLLVTLPQGMQETGLYDVVVHNPEEQSCYSEELKRYEIIDKPVLTAISEDIDCLDQGARTYTLTGSNFYQNAAQQTPEVLLGGVALTVDALNGCTGLVDPSHGLVCTEMVVTIPQQGIPVGLHDFAITNPDVGCSIEEAWDMEFIAAPVLDSVSTSMECLAQDDQEIQLHGSDFYIPSTGGTPLVTINGTEQAVTYASDCTPLNASDSGQVCSTLHLSLSAGLFDSGSYDVQVQNTEPAQCISSTQSLVLSAPPELGANVPLSTCLLESDQTLTLTGAQLLSNTTTGELPTVRILDQEYVVDSLSDCTSSALDASFEECQTATLTLPQHGLPAGVHNIALQNPDPADCSVTHASVEIFDAPVVSGASLDLSCIDQADVEMTLYGANFLEINGNIPSVQIGSYSVGNLSLGGCTTLTGSQASQRCTHISLVIPQGAIAGGSHDVVVTNPDGASCASTDSFSIDVVGAPVVTEVKPNTACYESPDTISVEILGTSFLQLADGTLPTMKVAGVDYAPTSASGCVPFGSTGVNLCESLFIDIDLGDYNSAQSLSMQVVNPPEIGCNSNSNFAFELTGPPVITSITPSEVCDDGRSFVISGDLFTNSSSVLLGTDVLTEVTYIDAQTIEVQLPASYGEGTYDVTIRNVDSCSVTESAGLKISSPPIAFFVDPQVIYNGVSLQATLYASDINYDVTSVIIEEAATGDQQSLTYTYDAADPNKVQFIVPEGLNEGQYTIHIEDQLTCGSSLSDAFFVEKDISASIEAVDPAFGYTGDYTSVQVTSDGSSGLDTFQDVPRFYLNPTTSGALATEIFGVNFQNDTQVDAIIPSGLQAGFYDLVVINPDGGVGFLASAVEVLNEPLPLISTLSPGSFDTSADGKITIIGENLDPVSAVLECRSGPTASSVEVSASVGTGTSTAYEITVDMSDADLVSGLVCIVSITNSSGATANFSSVSITNPSGNLVSFYAGDDMDMARRAPSTAVGRATFSARYLYALGGDSGAGTAADDSIEYAQVDKYGVLQSWDYLPTTLAEARTLTTAAVIGRYIYLAGGSDGLNTLDSVHRAQVLDPLESPRISSVDLNLTTNSQLETGAWIYRISALYPTSYDDNPGGESLPSDAFVVRLPNATQPLEVVLSWDAVPNASAYRIYRSPVADSPSGSEEMLVETTATEFTDQGASTDSSVVPLPQGALGAWSVLPSLNVERSAPCVATARHPTDPTKHYLYVAGGVDSTGTTRNDIEFLEITEVSEHDHETSMWTMNSRVLTSARSECGSFVVDNTINPYIPSDEVYVYFGSGKDASGGIAQSMNAGRVSSTGDLSMTSTPTTLYPVNNDFGRMGYSYGTAGGYLYVFGGGKRNGPNTTILNSAISAELCGPTSTGGQICSGLLPDTSNWNADPVSLSHPRYLSGITKESSLFFILGGTSDTEAATNTVDWIYY